MLFFTEKSGKQGIILYVDQSKAFDRVEWKWMRLVLQKFNFGQKFISWINTLYKKAKSAIFTNGFVSKMFSLSHSVRQGTPLSTYLYIIQA